MEMKNLVNLRAGLLASVFAIATALTACSGDGSATSSTGDTASPVVSGTNPIVPVGVAGAPQISGVPATSAKVGQPYSFQPSATDPNQAALAFSITGAPSWMTLSSTTGRVTGIPTSGDVGTAANIVVTVSNGTSSAALAAFTVTVAAVGTGTGSANLSWIAPTENTDGSALTDLSGYVIHYGTESQNYTSTITITNPGMTQYVVEDLAAGKYFFSMNTITKGGVASSPSLEASTTIS